MTLFKPFGKVGKPFIPLFLLSLLSAGCSNCPRWDFQETITCSPYFNSGRIFLPPTNPLREVELEISRGGNGTEMYLNALAFTFNYETSNLLMTTVEVEIEDELFIFEADLFVGGQRIKLPADMTEKIALALINHQTVTIRSGRFTNCLSSDGFAKALAKLEKIPVGYSSIP